MTIAIITPLYRGPQKPEQQPGKDSYIQQDFLNRTAGRGEARMGPARRKGHSGQPGRDCQKRIVRTGQQKQESKGRTARTG
jgi:hypothetical protein